MRRPERNEYFDYYHLYVSRVPDGEIVETLQSQLDGTLDLLAGIGEKKAGHRYAPGKWSIKEVVGHVVDVERLFAYRALAFARRDPEAIPGMDQDEWVRHANFHARTLKDITLEFRHLRLSNVSLFAGFDDDIRDRVGTASGCTFTVRSILWIMAGHELHHRSVLQERYLDAVG